MKNQLFATFAVALCLVITSHVFAQSATKTQAATAQITTALSFSSGTDLKFGSVAAGGSAGTVVLSSAGVRSIGSGTVALVSACAAPAAAAGGGGGGPGGAGAGARPAGS